MESYTENTCVSIKAHKNILKMPLREERVVLYIIIKFPYNARSDWLKQRTLSEYKGRVNDIKLAFKFLLPNFDKFDPNHPLGESDKLNINELFVSSKYGSWRPSLTTVV